MFVLCQTLSSFFLSVKDLSTLFLFFPPKTEGVFSTEIANFANLYQHRALALVRSQVFTKSITSFIVFSLPHRLGLPYWDRSILFIKFSQINHLCLWPEGTAYRCTQHSKYSREDRLQVLQSYVSGFMAPTYPWLAISCTHWILIDIPNILGHWILWTSKVAEELEKWRHDREGITNK